MAPRVLRTSGGVATVALDDGSTVDVAVDDAMGALSSAMPGAYEPITGVAPAAPAAPAAPVASSPTVESVMASVAPTLDASRGRLAGAIAPLTGAAAPEVAAPRVAAPARRIAPAAAVPAAPAAPVAPFESAAGETVAVPASDIVAEYMSRPEVAAAMSSVPGAASYAPEALMSLAPAAPVAAPVAAPMSRVAPAGTPAEWMRTAAPVAPGAAAAPGVVGVPPEVLAEWMAAASAPEAAAPLPPAVEAISRSAAAPISAAAAAEPIPMRAAIATPAARAVTAPRTVGAARARRAPTEAELNSAFIDALTSRPRGAAPLVETPTESPLDASIRNMRELQNLAVRRAEIEGTGYAMTVDAMAGAEAARAENERMRQDAARVGVERYRQATDRAAALSIDPEGWFHNRGALGTIAAAISVGLGSLGSAVMGGPNVALEIINDSISRDLQAQQTQIDQGWRAADAQSNLLDMMNREFQSRDAAIAASRANMLELAAARVGEMSTGIATREARINAEAMERELRAQAAASAAEAANAEATADLQRRLLEARVRSREAQAMRDERRAMGGGGAAPRVRIPTTAQMEQFNQLAATTGRAAGDIAAEAGFTGYEGTARFASPMTSDQTGLVSALDAQIGELERLIGPEGEDIPGVGQTGMFPAIALSEAGQDVRQQLTAVTEMVGRLHSGGAITDREFELFSSILEGAGTDRALRRGLRIIRNELAARSVRAVEPEGRAARAAGAAEAAGARRVD